MEILAAVQVIITELKLSSVQQLNKYCLSFIQDAYINLACCFFYLGMYAEAEKMCNQSDKNQLKTRLRFHLAHKFGDEKKLMTFHQELEDVIEDQLSLASIHYLRSHYQVKL